MLQAIRKNRRIKTLVTLALLLAQCLLFAAEAAHVTLAEQTDQAHHLLTQNTASNNSITSDPLSPASESRCDNCCVCHGHSSHLALLTTLETPVQLAQTQTLLPYSSALPAVISNNIHRPPIV